MGNPTVVSLKLLVNTQTKQVLYAEADKDFIDFLFCILTLPVAKVISPGLVYKHSTTGSLSNLYDSVQNLNEAYIQPNKDKNTLLKPSVSPAAISCVPNLLSISNKPPDKYLYRCQYQYANCSNSVSDDPRAICPGCRRAMTFQLKYVAPPAPEQHAPGGEGGGFVKGMVTYMVTDDLVVSPMSTISSITILNKFKVKDIAALEEKVVDVGWYEARKLLNASLETKKVLTYVFLK